MPTTVPSPPFMAFEFPRIKCHLEIKTLSSSIPKEGTKRLN